MVALRAVDKIVKKLAYIVSCGKLQLSVDSYLLILNSSFLKKFENS